MFSPDLVLPCLENHWPCCACCVVDGDVDCEAEGDGDTGWGGSLTDIGIGIGGTGISSSSRTGCRGTAMVEEGGDVALHLRSGEDKTACLGYRNGYVTECETFFNQALHDIFSVVVV